MNSTALLQPTNQPLVPAPIRWMCRATGIVPIIRKLAVTLLAVLGLAGLSYAATGDGAGNPKPAASVDYGKVPLAFEPNHGQTDPRVQFFSRGQGYGIFLTPNEAVLALKRPSPKADPSAKPRPTQTSTLRMTLVGADARAVASAHDQLPGTSNYFFGSDAKKWATDVQTYGKVQFKGVYPGVDLVYYGNQRQLEYDFVVAPNADASKIALSFTGAAPRLNASGDLLLSTPGGETSFHKPVVYQMTGDAKVMIDASYNVAKQGVTFSLGAYDHSKQLVIDPVLSYGTFLGGSLDDRGFGIAADAAGNAYIAGDTVSLNFPLMNAIQTTNHNTSNGWVVFVTKLNPTGSAVLYSTFVGGVADSHALGIAIDSAGSAYVAGNTSAGDFPVTSGAFQTICGGNATNINGTHARANGCAPSSDTDGFVFKLNPAGNSLVYSSFLGGSGFTQATGIAVNAAGEAYVGGNTNAGCGYGPYWATNHAYPDSWDCFPVTAGAYQTTLGGQTKPGSTIWGFFSKVSADGSTLLYSTEFLAPTGTTPNNTALANTVGGVAVDAAGFGYIVGSAGYGLPTTSGAFYVPPVNSTSALPPYPAYVAKFDPTKSGSASLVYSTFLGSAVQTANASNYSNVATSIAVDASGNAIVAGYTNVCGFPTTTGAYLPSRSTAGNGGTTCNDGFVTKVNSTGTGLVWSTLLGSGTNPTTSNTSLTGLALDANGNIYVSANVGGATFPLVHPLRSAVSGGSLIAELDPTGSNLLFSSYLGSYGTSGYGGTDVATAVAVDPSGNMYITGRMDSNTLTIPTTAGALQTTYQGGSYDAFVLKIAPTIVSTTTLAVPTGTVSAGQQVTLTATVAGPTGTAAIPTGTVTFLSGSTTLGTGMLNASGVATYTASSLNATTYTVTASYPGDTNFAPSVSSASTLVVSPVTPTIKLTAPATANVGASVTLSVAVTGTTGTPTGTVVFKDGTTTLSTMSLASGMASYSTSNLAVGAHSITVSYSGDSIFASGVSPAQTVTVSLLTPTVTLTAPATAVVNTSVSLSVAVAGTGGTPTGTVIFKDGTTTLSTVTLSSGAASYSTSSLAVGAHSITASYSGDSTFAAAVSAAQTVTINVAPAVTFTAAPTSLTIVHGNTGTIVITGTPVGGYTGTATFACGPLPTAASCTFAPTSLVFSGNNTAQTTTLTIATSMTTAGYNLMPGLNTATGIVAALLIFPLGFARRRKQFGHLVSGAILMAMITLSSAAFLGLTGCSSNSGPTTTTTPAGSYSVAITVTATNANSTITLPVVIQ